MPRKSNGTPKKNCKKDEFWRFLSGEGDLSSDKRIALLASCVANQQRFAGFKNTIDIREFKCPDCKESGFNPGMGTIVFTCGSEWFPDDEGFATQCPAGIAKNKALIAELKSEFHALPGANPKGKP